MSLKRNRLLIMCITLVGMNFAPRITRAQAQPIVLTLAVESFIKDNLLSSTAGSLLKIFEDAHPDVTVKVVAADGVYKSFAYDGADAYFSDWQRYANTADVLFVKAFESTPEAVHGGYLLDLQPLIDTDKNANVDDFYAAALKSFQFDGGTWALPVTTGWITTLNYDPQAFDAVGLSYPTDHWTLDDLINAARKLAQKDGSGKVTRAGIDVSFGGDALLAASLGAPLVDQTAVPNLPQLDRPDVIVLLNKWLDFQKEGIVGPKSTPGTRLLTYNAPLSIDAAYNHNADNPEGDKLIPVLLPGGKAGVEPEGYAVSGGTHHPELAYALTQFLTTQLSDFYGPAILPARRSIGHLAQAQLGSLYKAEQRAFIENAVEQAIPQSDLRYFGDFFDAMNRITSGKSPDAATALHTEQTNALKNLQLAAARRQSTILNVASPDLPPLAAGQRAIRFNVGTFYTDTLNRAAWDHVIQDFTAHDLTIKRIDLDTSNNGNLSDLTRQYDCFYLPTSAISRAQNGQLLNIDPLIDADKNYNRTAVPRGVLTQLQYDNKLWAYPLTFSPSVLRYDATQFAQVGLALPKDGWDFSAFHDALNTLKTTSTSPVFSPGVSSGSALLALIAADGGLPLDFRTDPPTVDFTSPATVAAIRQVLDLAKQGLIDYHELGQFEQQQPPGGALIYADAVATSDFFHPDNGKLTLANYPRRSDGSVLVYDVGGGYISAGAANPEDCYRWLTTLAQHPELLSGLPIQPSALASPALSAAPNTVSFAKAYLAQLDMPDTISIPSPDGTPYVDAVLEITLYKAFDDYVLHNGDLESALVQADQKAKGFSVCLNGADAHAGDSYSRQLSNCVKAAGL